MDEMVREKKRRRFQYLHELYKRSGGSERRMYDAKAIGEALGWNKEETENVYEYLKAEGLIRYMATGPAITITHAGVVEVEQALVKPDIPTQHFLPINQVFVAGDMVHSVLQQGTTGSNLVVTFPKEHTGELLEFLKQLKDVSSNLRLGPSEQSELQADIQTIESQTASPKPKAGIISSCLEAIGTILEKGSTYTSTAVGFLEQLKQLRGYFMS